MMTTLNNYKDVQDLLNNFVSAAGVSVAGAPHGAFWESQTYEEFTTGNVPVIGIPILEVGNSKNSNIIEILQGVGDPTNEFGQMPRPNPPYDSVTPSQKYVIDALSAWIDAGCPNS